MRILNFRTLVICILVTGAAGALGSAILSSPYMKIRDFQVETDEDTLRTRPLIDLLETYNDRLFFQVSAEMLRDDISAFKQVERVTITRTGLSSFNVKIDLRRPLLVVTNGSERICLGPGGIPFPDWSEHESLPVFNVPAHLSAHHLLEPDSSISDYYHVILHIVSQPLNSLSSFSHLVENNDYEIQLADRQNTRLLRLPRIRFRDPASSLINLNQWLATKHDDSLFRELDARFPGTVIIRPLKGDLFNG